jgi:hypothetical protein
MKTDRNDPFQKRQP